MGAEREKKCVKDPDNLCRAAGICRNCISQEKEIVTKTPIAVFSVCRLSVIFDDF